MDRYEGFPARGTGSSTPNAHAVAPSGPKCPSRSRIYDGGSLRRFLHTQTGEANVDAYLTWTLSPGGAAPAAVSCLDVFFQHSEQLQEGPHLASTQALAVEMSLIERRVREPVDHRRVRRHAGGQSDAKIRLARRFSLSESPLLVSAEMLGPFSPTRHRDHPGALSTGVGPYERTP